MAAAGEQAWDGAGAEISLLVSHQMEQASQ